MAGTTFVDADAILKDWYHGDKVYPQYIEATELLNAIGTSSRNVVNDVGGRQVVWPLRRGLTQGLGARAAGQQLPFSRKQLLNAIKFPMKKNVVRVQIEGEAWRAARGNKTSFVPLLREETNNALSAHSKDLNFQLYGQGTGVRGNIVSVTLVSGGAAPTAAVYEFEMDDVRGFQEDMLLDNYTSGGAVIDASTAALLIVVTEVDRNNSVITVSFPTGHTLPAATNVLYRAGNKGNEMMGLDGIVNDAAGPATLQNITVATAPWWMAFVNDPGVPTALTLENMELCHNGSLQQNGFAPDKIFTSFKVKTVYEQLLINLKRFVTGKGDGTPVLDGGYERLSYNNVPMIFDTDCQQDVMFFLQTKQLAVFHQFGYEWVNSPDTKFIWRPVTDYDAYEAVGFYEAELATYRRNTAARLNNILVS